MFTEILDQKWSIDKGQGRDYSTHNYFCKSLPRESNHAVLCISNDELTREDQLKYYGIWAHDLAKKAFRCDLTN